MKQTAKQRGPARIRRRLATLTLQEIADRLGISQVRCQQLEARALAKLRQHPLIRQLAEEMGITG